MSVKRALIVSIHDESFARRVSGPEHPHTELVESIPMLLPPLINVIRQLTKAQST
jgi:hypothetical protein